MRRILQSAALMAALGISAVSSAQSGFPAPEYVPVNISVKAGIALPIDSTLTNVAKTFLALGAEYQLPTSLIKGSDTYFSLDWFTKGFRGERANVFPFMINQRFYTGTDRTQGRRRYFFLGVGVSFIDVTTSDTVLGARGGFGAELGDNIFTEAALYIGDQGTGGIHPNAIGLWLGYRF